MVCNIASTHVYEHVKWMCVLPVKSRISYKEMDFIALIVKLTLIYMSTHEITLFECLLKRLSHVRGVVVLISIFPL